MSNYLLISGVPHCGKSWFGDYLRDNFGYVHLDLEAKDHEKHLLHEAFKNYVQNDLAAFVENLRRLHPRVVITWGYPIAWVNKIPEFQKAGLDCWWFDGDIDKSEEEWTEREGHAPSGNAAQQFKDLKMSSSEFPRVYGSNIVRILDSTGQYLLSQVQIAERLNIPDYPDTP